MGCFILKPLHLQIMCLGYITIYYNVVVKSNSVFFLEKSHHNVFWLQWFTVRISHISLLARCFQQQKHVCAFSSGYPLLKWDRPHIPLSTEKGFDHCMPSGVNIVKMYCKEWGRYVSKLSLLVVCLSRPCK